MTALLNCRAGIEATALCSVGRLPCRFITTLTGGENAGRGHPGRHPL